MSSASKTSVPAGRKLRHGQPIWLERRRGGARAYPVLRGNREVDVAIVGGGMTGCAVAREFVSAGAHVAVVEGALVGRGSTAASSALLLQEPDRGLMDLGRRYGKAASRRIWALSRDAARGLIDTLRRLNVGCDLAERDSIHFTTSESTVPEMRLEYAGRRQAGFRGEWLTPGALRELTGVTGFGAIRTRGNAHFDPYRACVGVARSAARDGAEIFERSPVRRIEPTRHGVRLRTTAGRIDARHVVIATGYATEGFRPLAGRFEMFHTFVLATERLRARDRRELGLSDVMLWDTERPYHYARWTADRRLLLGGGDRPVGPGTGGPRTFAAAVAELREYFTALYPALAGIRIEGGWQGLFAMTPDSLPYIGPHRRYPHHLFALGYGGNGMTFAFLAARMLREWWQGRASSDHELFGFSRSR